jgi:hypothetical protein
MPAADGTLHMAVANAIHNLQFNGVLFKVLLIQWVVTNIVRFHGVEEYSLYRLLSYLIACICQSRCVMCLIVKLVKD